jgi:hypothetical protein
MADTDYTIPAPSTNIDTTGSIGSLNPTEQLPVSSNGLHEYPTATKTYQASLMDPNKSRVVFVRDVITTELPGADGTGNGSNTWQNATATINYTDEGYGEEV